MDAKEASLVADLHERVVNRLFHERDVLALLILLRDHAPKASPVRQLSDFIAHREKDRSRQTSRNPSSECWWGVGCRVDRLRVAPGREGPLLVPRGFDLLDVPARYDRGPTREGGLHGEVEDVGLPNRPLQPDRRVGRAAPSHPGR
jgi:hypothetical protein